MPNRKKSRSRSRKKYKKKSHTITQINEKEYLCQAITLNGTACQNTATFGVNVKPTTGFNCCLFCKTHIKSIAIITFLKLVDLGLTNLESYDSFVARVSGMDFEKAKKHMGF